MQKSIITLVFMEGETDIFVKWLTAEDLIMTPGIAFKNVSLFSIALRYNFLFTFCVEGGYSSH